MQSLDCSVYDSIATLVPDLIIHESMQGTVCVHLVCADDGSAPLTGRLLSVKLFTMMLGDVTSVSPDSNHRDKQAQRLRHRGLVRAMLKLGSRQGLSILLLA